LVPLLLPIVWGHADSFAGYRPGWTQGDKGEGEDEEESDEDEEESSAEETSSDDEDSEVVRMNREQPSER
jgi:hypothetical protein